MSPWLFRWAPAAVMGLGALVTTLGVSTQRSLPLRSPLGATIPTRFEGWDGRDLRLSDAEREAVGVTDYLVRAYSVTGDSAAPATFSLYVGYYDRQMRGKSIHSPKNCLPGAGWEALSARTAEIPTATDTVTVNRYLIQKGQQRALVFYWYQGRGRVASNEYAVKWNLLRDAALRRRSDEALVRIVVPVTSGEADAQGLATGVARQLVPAVFAALPD